MDVDQAAEVIHLAPPACWPGYRALGEAGDSRGLEILVEELSDSDWTRRRAAAEALGMHALGAGAAAVVRERLADPSPFVVRAALEAVAAMRDTESRAGVLGLLGDPDDATRLAALHAVDALWESDDVARVLALARRDPSIEVRKRAGWVLRDHVTAETWEPVFDLWSGSPLPRERTWAAEIAAAFGGATASERIRPLLRDPDGHVRSAAARVSSSREDDAHDERPGQRQ